ncbi:MAG: GatB/YqeY domain-containing protein [Bacteroidales bacterium]|nr:GatB/YqeY domain-containing protein [Bacteroidales bacterium]
MSLEIIINNDIKAAMFSKDKKKLEALRAIKSALLLEKTGKHTTDGEISKDTELKLLQKLVKQRKESAKIYQSKDRNELVEEELFQASIIEKYLPEKINEDELVNIIKQIIEKTGASSIKDMGKVMGMAAKEMAGRADNKTIAKIIKNLLV